MVGGDKVYSKSEQMEREREEREKEERKEGESKYRGNCARTVLKS